MRNKYIAAGLALIFGLFGIHKFYLGKTWWGVAYIIVSVFGGMYVLAFVCFFEAIFYLVVSKKIFNKYYNDPSIFCEYCGEEYVGDVNFCPFCGKHNPLKK